MSKISLPILRGGGQYSGPMTENHKECGGGGAMRVKLNFIDFAASCKKFNDSILKNRTKTNKFQAGGGLTV